MRYQKYLREIHVNQKTTCTQRHRRPIRILSQGTTNMESLEKQVIPSSRQHWLCCSNVNNFTFNYYCTRGTSLLTNLYLIHYINFKASGYSDVLHVHKQEQMAVVNNVTVNISTIHNNHKIWHNSDVTQRQN